MAAECWRTEKNDTMVLTELYFQAWDYKLIFQEIIGKLGLQFLWGLGWGASDVKISPMD